MDNLENIVLDEKEEATAVEVANDTPTPVAEEKTERGFVETLVDIAVPILATVGTVTVVKKTVSAGKKAIGWFRNKIKGTKDETAEPEIESDDAE